MGLGYRNFVHTRIILLAVANDVWTPLTEAPPSLQLWYIYIFILYSVVPYGNCNIYIIHNGNLNIILYLYQNISTHKETSIWFARISSHHPHTRSSPSHPADPNVAIVNHGSDNDAIRRRCHIRPHFWSDVFLVNIPWANKRGLWVKICQPISKSTAHRLECNEAQTWTTCGWKSRTRSE